MAVGKKVVVEKMNKKNTSRDAHPVLGSKLTLGQRAADKLTSGMGSWGFILMFLFFMMIWILINAYFLIIYTKSGAFDRYPFILLNLVLSCLAAIQAPIILMSQNREAEKDRARMNYDYQVNRKAERGIQKLQKDVGFLKRKLGGKK
ncbi:MAG: DUF1003 domain-containing protein [Nanoarchaeota archaeon]|nr:DUF1003 domain-containing protein [Nanoarchaeota archaeon]